MFSLTLQENLKKMVSISKKCLYLGFQVGVKGHLSFDLNSKDFFLEMLSFWNQFFITSHPPIYHPSVDLNLIIHLL